MGISGNVQQLPEVDFQIGRFERSEQDQCGCISARRVSRDEVREAGTVWHLVFILSMLGSHSGM